FGSTVALAAMRERPGRIPRGVLQAPVAHKPLSRSERFFAWLMSYLPGTMASLPLRRRLMTRLHHAAFAGRPPEVWDHLLSSCGSVSIRAVGRRGRMLHHIDLRPILSEIRQPILLL